jgi:hypothetical protein
MNNGRILSPMVAAPQQPVMQLAAPLNDIQLVALVAAQRPDVLPADAVKWANDILLEAIKQGRNLQESIKAWQRQSVQE